MSIRVKVARVFCAMTLVPICLITAAFVYACLEIIKHICGANSYEFDQMTQAQQELLDVIRG